MNKGIAARWMMLFLLLFSPLMMVMTAPFAFAAPGPQTFTLDGRIKQAGTTTPILDPSVKIEIHVMNPSRTCVIYAEEQFVNTQTSNGYFNIQVGSNIGAGKRIAGVDPGLSMATVFQNTTPMTGTNVAGQTCPAGTYTPLARDSRYFRIFVTPSGTAVTDQLTDIVLDAVPTAMVAETADKVGNFGPADLLRVNTVGVQVLSQANLENIFTSSNYAVLTSLLAGTSNLYNRPASNGTNVLPTIAAPTSPSAGQIWYNAGNVYFHDGAVTRTISTGSSTSVSAADGSAAAPTISFASDTNTGWYLAAPDNLAAATGGVERVRINENGNLGIGSSAPGARLTLGGDMSASAWQAGGIGIRQNSANYTDTTSSGTVGFNYVNAFGVPTLIASSATTYTNASSFSMYPPVPGANVTLTNSTALTINSTSLVGGGGVTNGYGLQVNAPTGATNNYSATFMGGNVGIGTTAPTASLHLKAGTTAAGTAPLKLTAGPVNTTAEAGAIEFDGTSLFYTDSTNTRRTLGVAGAGITALTGDVTASGAGSVVATIPNDTVTFAKMQNIATQRLLGRSTAAAGDVEELTVGTGLTITGGALNLTDTTDDDSFATLLGVCGNGFVPYKSGGVWTCLEARSDLVNDTLVLRGATGSFEGNQVTANSLRLHNAGAYVSINTPAAANYTLTLPADDGTTSGQVLTTNGSGVLSWTTPVASGGTGLFADGTAAAPSISFVNDTNTGIYRVGANELGFAANGSMVANMTTTTFGLNGIGMAKLQNGIGAGAPTYSFLNDENTGIYNIGADIIGFSTNGAERMRLNASGNVGIGTTAPDTKLMVDGTIRVGDGGETCAGGNFTGGIRYNGGSLQFCDGAAWTTLGSGSGSGDFLANGTIPMTGSFRSIAGTAALPGVTFVGDTNTGISAETADTLVTSTAGAERMRVDSAGLVGIGTTEPLSRLTVTPVLDATLPSEEPAISFTSGNDTSGFTHTSLGYYNSTGSDPVSYIQAHNSGYNAPFVINPYAGYVGVGTFSPATKLDVVGSLKVGNGGETCGATYAGAIRYNATNLQFCNGTAWTTLGTGSGSGDFLRNGSLAMTGAFKAANGTSANPGISFVDDDTGLYYTSGHIGFSTNGLNRMTLYSNGNLGIGTAVAPSAALEVKGDIAISGSTSGSVKFAVPAVAGSATYTWPAAAPASNMVLQSNNTGALSWVAAGGSGDFLANGTVPMTGALQFIAGSSAAPGIAVVGDSDTGIYSAAANNLSFATGGIPRLALNSLGDFNILTGNVNIAGGAVRGLSGAAGVPAYSFSSDTNTGIYSSAADTLSVSTNGTERMRIDNTKTDIKGNLSMSGSTSGAVTFAVPAAAGSATYTWPAAAPASNMVLQSDNTGALSWVTAGGGGTPAGANTEVQFNSGGSFGASSVMTFNAGDGLYLASATNQRVRISKIGLVEAISDSGNTYSATSASANVPDTFGATIKTLNRANQNNYGSFYLSETRNSSSNEQLAYFGTVSASGAGVYTPNIVIGQSTGASAYAERMRINTSGDVGIGTTAPTTKLHVSGTLRVGDGGETCGASYTGGIRYNGGNLQYCNGTAWTTLAGGSGLPAANGTAAAPSISFASDSNTGIYRTGADSIGFSTGGGNRVTIDDNTLLLGLGYQEGLRIDSGGGGYGLVQIASPNGTGGRIRFGNGQSSWAWDTAISRPAAGTILIDNNAGGAANLEVNGFVKVGTTATLCPAAGAGSIRYNAGAMEFCDGASWAAIGGGGGGSGDFLRNGTLQMTGNLRLGTNWLSNDGGSEGISIDANGGITVLNTAGSVAADFKYSGGTSIISVTAGTVGGGSGVLLQNNTGANYAQFDFTSAGKLSINNQGNNNLTLTNAGEVGVNTAFPTAKLEVNGTFKLGNGGELCPAVGAGGLRYNGGALELCDGATWAAVGGAGAPSADSLDFTHFADAMTLDASTDIRAPSGQAYALSITNEGTGNSFVVNDQATDTTPFVINASGMVGIRNPTPNYPLDVANGSVGMVVGADVGNSTRTDLTAKAGALGAAHYENAQPPVIMIKADSTATESIISIGGNSASGNAATDIRFFTDPLIDSGAGNERMRITSAGSVGIGTTIPQHTLHVHQSVDGGGPLFKVENSNSGSSAQASMALTNNGGVSATFGITSSAFSGVMPTSSTYLGGGGANGMTIGTFSSAPIRFATNGLGLERMRVDSGGNVGIGTTNPTSALEVNGAIRVANGSAAAPSLSFSNTTNTGLYSASAGNLNISLGGSTRITMDSSNFYGNVTAAPHMKIDGTSTAASPVYTFTGDVNLGMFRAGADILAFTNNGSETVRIDATGSVGIGTTNPTEKLHVNGNVLATAYLYTSDKRLKKDIEPLDESLQKILSLSAVSYHWTDEKKDGGREQIGLIAQDVREVYPQAVREDSQGWLRVDYPSLIAPIVKAVQELYAQLTGVKTQVETLQVQTAEQDRALASEVEQLRKENKEMKERLEKIEKMLNSK